jgi:hypothetical protein
VIGLRSSVLWLLICCFATSVLASGETVSARRKQGSSHGFLLLKSADGKIIAVGDQITVTHGDGVRSRLVFRFRDGSVDDETTVFRQGTVLALVSDHHIQRGPSFKEPLNMTVNVAAQQVTWHEMKDGKDEVETQHMDMPPDLANGLVSPILENFPAKTTEMKVSYIAGGSKPRLVKLAITRGDEDRFRVGGTNRRAGVFNIHIEIGGVAGAVAPVIGKQPSDIKVWVMDGEVPTFLKMVGALYQRGPIWTMVLTSPSWPGGSRD